MHHSVTGMMGRAHKSCWARRKRRRKGRTAAAESFQQLLLQDAHGGLCTGIQVHHVSSQYSQSCHYSAACQNDPLLGSQCCHGLSLVSEVLHVNIMCPVAAGNPNCLDDRQHHGEVAHQILWQRFSMCCHRVQVTARQVATYFCR